MARPEEKGIRYFSMDTNMLEDRKIKRVTHPYGPQSIAVILKLWSLGYEENGYYLTIDKNLAFDIAFEFRLEESYVNDVILACIEAEIFDKTLWDIYEILTSRRMQENFLAATRKRKNAVIDNRYLINAAEETEFPAEETPKGEEESTTNVKNEVETQQIKLNKIKLNKIDDVNIINSNIDARARGTDDNELDKEEEKILEDVFGDISEHTKAEYIKLEKQFGWALLAPALRKTKRLGGETINYTRTILEETHAARA